MNTVSSRIHQRLAVFAFAAALIGSLILVSPAADAAESDLFGPQVITGIPAQPAPGAPLVHKVVKLKTISAPMTAGKTAYVYSKLRAQNSAHVNLVDSEIICSGAGSMFSPRTTALDPANGAVARRDITIVNRFLVSATSTGTLTCSIYLRSNSLALGIPSSSMTVSGELRFASYDVKEDASGAAIEVHEPWTPTGTPINSGDPVYLSEIDRVLPAGYSSVAVAADTEFMSCIYRRANNTSECPDTWDISYVRFTLFVHSMNGNTICASAPSTQVDLKVTRQTHHKVAPLYATVAMPPNCNRLFAYVKAEYMGNYVGGMQGVSVGLYDGDLASSGPQHDSAMTHAFAVPS
jgi:hypothetical protein